MSSSKLFDIFAEFQKNMHREVGALMGSVLAASNGPSPTPVISSFDGLETRILAAVDERLKAFEEKMTPVRVGVKRTRTPTVSSDDEDDEIPAPPPAPIKVNRAVAVQVDDSAVASLTEKLNAIQVEVKPVEVKPVEVKPEPVEVKTPVKVEEAKAVEVKAPVKAEEEAADEEEEIEEEESEQQSDADDDEEEEEESLTEIMYKGKKYYMDGEYNIYGVDADGELVEDPVGQYDEKTRRIVFHNSK